MPTLVSRVAMITSQQPSRAALPAKQRPETTPTSGTRPLSFANCAKVGTSRPVTPSRSVSPGLPPPPSANRTSGMRWRSAIVNRRSCFVIALALRAGEHHVIVGDDHAARAVRFEMLCIDGGEARDHAVARRVANEVVERAAGALRGDGEDPYSMKLPSSTRGSDILPRRAMIRLATLRDSVGRLSSRPKPGDPRNLARSARIAPRSIVSLRAFGLGRFPPAR